MRMPSETREPPDLSLNKVDNLATKFANLAIRYHDLGHEYLVEQSNEELDAQRNNKAQTQTDKLSVKISNIITRVCLCDPEVTGTPIVMCSRDFQLPIAAVENDDGMLLNLPEDHNGCALRIERGENGRKVYYLDISMPLIDNNDGVNKFAILSHIDITSAVDQLAVQEYRAQRASFKSAVSFDLEGDDWIEQAVIESDKEQALIRYEETYLGPPSPHMRRLLAFIQTLKREHLECCVFAGKKDIGWELINWKVHHISEQLYEPGKRPIYEKGMDEYIWESIAHHMDESEDGFQWPQKISWGRTKELRLGYFVPMTDGHHIDDERREKWWLMVLSDFDEDIWRTERIV
jgi:hypothetical protein